MAYDEEQQRRSRVVVETPSARREVEQVQTTRVPERQGFSTGAVAALVLGAVALVTLLFLFMMKSQDTANDNVRVNANMPATAQQPQQQPVIIQQPAPQQQPVVIQQPATSQPAPIVVTAPATDSGSATTSSGTDDMAVQTNVDKKISEDTTFSTLGITAIVIDGKVTLSGTVDTETLKSQAERLVKGVKGVRTVENKIIVTG